MRELKPPRFQPWACLSERRVKMKLSKAKEIIDLNLKEAGKKMPPDVRSALQLGSEAIDRCLFARKETSFVGPALLPSETED